MKKPLATLIAALATLATPSIANAFCFSEAANRYGVSETLLRAIAKTESSFNPNARNVNKNGSEDIGLMQINTTWLPTLARHGIGRKELWDPCVNVNIGAWVLSHNMARHGETWKAVGAYNAVTPSKQAVYIQKVWKNTHHILREGSKQ